MDSLFGKIRDARCCEIKIDDEKFNCFVWDHLWFDIRLYIPRLGIAARCIKHQPYRDVRLTPDELEAVLKDYLLEKHAAVFPTPPVIEWNDKIEYDVVVVGDGDRKIVCTTYDSIEAQAAWSAASGKYVRIERKFKD